MTYRRRLGCLLLLLHLPAGCGGDTTGSRTGSVQPGNQCESDGAKAEAGDGCNTCTCSGGTWACTDMACGEPCTEGGVTNDDCNSCSCTGGEWVCTNKACPPPAKCTDGDTRPSDDGCNTCTCTGGSWGCTERACPGGGVGCGARLGDTCSGTEYCAYEEGQYCGAADASSVCKPRPTICTTIYAPVCGCDGKTYSSDCSAAGAGTGVLQSGECPPQL